jgi:hypothetical protein
MKESLPAIVRQWIENMFDETLSNNVRFNYYQQVINIQTEIDKATRQYENKLSTLKR